MRPVVGAVTGPLDARGGTWVECRSRAADRYNIQGRGWCTTGAGFRVTLFEARLQVSGNVRTYDWDLGAVHPDAVGEE